MEKVTGKFLLILMPWIWIRDRIPDFTKVIESGFGTTTTPENTCSTHPTVPVVQSRVANLGDFSTKNANLGIFLAFRELGDF
jgi:hypothetical protein